MHRDGKKNVSFYSPPSLSFSLSLSHTHTHPPPFSDEDDWNVIIKECGSLAANWEHLSGFLGLSIGLIDSIKATPPVTPVGCLNEALKHWVRQNYKTDKFGLPSWRTLLESVARVNRLLFKKLAEKYPGSYVYNIVHET